MSVLSACTRAPGARAMARRWRRSSRRGRRPGGTAWTSSRGALDAWLHPPTPVAGPGRRRDHRWRTLDRRGRRRPRPAGPARLARLPRWRSSSAVTRRGSRSSWRSRSSAAPFARAMAARGVARIPVAIAVAGYLAWIVLLVAGPRSAGPTARDWPRHRPLAIVGTTLVGAAAVMAGDTMVGGLVTASGRRDARPVVGGLARLRDGLDGCRDPAVIERARRPSRRVVRSREPFSLRPARRRDPARSSPPDRAAGRARPDPSRARGRARGSCAPT